MVRYFKKEVPENPLHLSHNAYACFKAAPSGVAIFATTNPVILDELDRLLGRRAGGLSEICEIEYLGLRDSGGNTRDLEAPTTEQRQIKERVAHGRTIFQPVPTGLSTTGRFIHVLERHQTSPDDERRISNAARSWKYHYERGVIPCHVWAYLRTALALGDSRDLPYLKDILSQGLELATAPDDILFLTNDDTVLHQAIIEPMRVMLQKVDALCSFRINFKCENMPPTSSPVAKIRQWGHACLGRDLFAFRAQWLRLNWNAIPDFLLGECEWDIVLAAMVRLAAGVRTTKLNITMQQPECELERGYLTHALHERNWTSEKFATAPAKIHNNHLMAEWCADNGCEALISGLL